MTNLSTVSTLFSSFNTNNTNAGFNNLSSLISDYNTIRSGSYGKLMRAYYRDMDSSALSSLTQKKTSRTNSTAVDSTSTIKDLQSTTDALTDSAKALYTSGSKSVFAKKAVTGEDGQTSQQYDTDAIYASVKKFADDYNKVLEAADKSRDSKVQNSVVGMINYTKTESAMLGKLGITIGSDHQMSIDEKAFKSADMSVAKSMFNGTGSYAYTIGSKSAMTNSYADMEAAQANTYNKYGSYGSTYNSGSIYNSYF